MPTTILPKPRSSLVQEPGRVTLRLPTRFDRYVPVLLSVWLAAWAVGEAVLLWMLLAPSERLAARLLSPLAATLVLIVFTATGLLLGARLLWVLRGREILSFSRGTLTFCRETGARLHDRRSIPLAGIQSVRVDRLDDSILYPSWGLRFLGKGPAAVTLSLPGEEFRICRGVSEEEAQYVAGVIRSQIKEAA